MGNLNKHFDNYYNTNREKGAELKASNNKAEKQEDLVFEIFKIRKKLSASEAWRHYCRESEKLQVPLTSIRRAITNLCNDHKLKKTKETAQGMFGKKEHIYEIRIKSKEQQFEIF